MMPAFWRLLAARHANPMLAPVCLPGMSFYQKIINGLGLAHMELSKHIVIPRHRRRDIVLALSIHPPFRPSGTFVSGAKS
ncbi:hypothetical protein DPMN_004648 [Dreissena polymorpha]|uniref:Uncharacterized protein n=1 Tax=Dreissena polymorpha TaxID=45954 RepID=A0A9D4RT62_DREPO|nr:hypothetical protein DPMN_004648 [Dreissena polymorpha]